MYFALVSILFSFGNVNAQSSSDPKSIQLFQSGEILELRLEADFKTVFSVFDDSTYFPAKISLIDNSGLYRNVKIKIRTRGKARRDKDVCAFTPLRLRFPKKKTSNTVFEGQRSIKLVTHCQKASVNEQNIILEYLIYKAFNILTDSSFRVRPAIINYVYKSKKKDSIQKFAFFIERDKHLKERLNGIELESVKIHPTRLNTYHACLMDMFQYMIGNLDYSAYELHNIKLIIDRFNDFPPIAVPYDFDLCGLVKPGYAVPHPEFDVQSVTDRVYRGFKKNKVVVDSTIAIFKSKRGEIYNLFEDNELLKKSERKRVVKYLNEFYKIINDEQLVKVEFIDNARVLHK